MDWSAPARSATIRCMALLRGLRLLVLPTTLAVAALGCASSGQAWVHESPGGNWKSSANEEPEAEHRHAQRSAHEPEPEYEPPPIPPRRTITLGQSYIPSADPQGHQVLSLADSTDPD